MSTIKPFLKWAGGKGQILNEIRSKYPTDLGKSINKYAEPFVGGGAVLFDILNNNLVTEAYISDVNRELIGAYIAIRDNVAELLCALKAMEVDYLPADTECRKEQYYSARERFNELKAAQSDSVELAALMIFLNRTCFNGLYRVNAKGGFNVPQGSYKNPKICDTDNLKAISEKLKIVNIVHGNYKLSKNFMDDKTFAYFDPPYRPLNLTSSFTSYTQDGFDDAQQTELAQFIDELTAKGVRVVASNSDPKNTDKNDDFFDRLYARHTIVRIGAIRAINSVGSSRGKISELIITSY